MSLVHEQDLALARGKPPDEFVVVRGFVPRLIDVATEDLRRLRIFELIGVPELVIILPGRSGLVRPPPGGAQSFGGGAPLRAPPVLPRRGIWRPAPKP